MSFPDYSLYIFIAKLLMLFETSFSDTCFYEYISVIMNFVFVLSLDDIFKRLYEDNLSGKITDERFEKLSQDYEAEQKF